MESHGEQNYKIAGNLSISGGVTMLIGAAFWGASGTDLWQTLANNDMENYLAQTESVKNLLVANTGFWILGVILMGSSLTLMSGFCYTNSGIAQVAKVCVQSAVSVAIVSFIIMLSLAIYKPTVEVANITGWTGTKLDDLATNRYC